VEFKKAFYVFFGLMLCLITSCSLRSPIPGLLYSRTLSGLAVSAQTASREGEACAHSYLGLISVGDASIEQARRNGGITSVASVDEKLTNYFVFYQEYCTVVRGR